MTLHLDQHWQPGGKTGALVLTLTHMGTAPIAGARLCLGLTLPPAPGARITGGTVRRHLGTHLDIALDATLAPGGPHRLTLPDLLAAPSNRTHGVLAAWLELPDGAAAPITCGDLEPPAGTARHPIRDWPEGRIDTPLGLLPWPARVSVSQFAPAPVLVPAPGTDPAPFAAIAALHRRLFPEAPAPIALSCPDGRPVATRHDPGLAPEAYRLGFGDTVTLEHADDAGRRHGLIALAQIAHAARTDARFGFPMAGVIEDAPRFAWRGCHFDVARNFHGAETVARLIDILAWLRINRLHWHLTDDEAWRLPSRAFPELTGIGALRSRNAPLPPFYADGPGGQTGAYTEAEITRIVAHAGTLGITVMPEIDMPGHATALLLAVPDLRDPGETADSYRSIQNFPNNALNPALPRSYDVLGLLLAEAAALFPDAPLHIGGDEVDAASWSGSPLARDWARDRGLEGTAQMQAAFMRRVKDIVTGLGRDLGAWDEAADGGGVAPEGTILFAWRSIERTAELIAAGYDVVATPGQAYYLDMVQGAGWDAPGAAWAGIAAPETTYAFDPAAGLPEGPGRLVGVQAGIWTEHLNTRSRLNEMMFPRLAAVAEAGWTPQEARDWPRFAALARLVPQL